MLDEVERAGVHVGVETKPVMMVRGPDELENAFATFVKDRVDAVVVQGSLAIKPVTDLAIKHRLPVSSTARAFAEIGGLLSFGADGPAAFRHGATFVHRVLQGKQPKDLPVEQPTKFDLTINLKTAKAMGLAIPEAFLLRADTVIE
jgi:putative ABC transport system substrate-binding protein